METIMQILGLRKGGVVATKQGLKGKILGTSSDMVFIDFENGTNSINMVSVPWLIENQVKMIAM